MSEYANPAVLVDTNWVKDHLSDPRVKLVEIDVDTKAYDAGHVPGAIGFNWQTELQDQTRRDIVSKEAFAGLVGGVGISANDTVVVYGDNHNWFAAYGFWLFKLYGHNDVRLMDGGRVKWLNEGDKPMTLERSKAKPVSYTAGETNMDLRAMLPEVMEASRGGDRNLVDVRSPEEYSGKVIAPPGLNETAQRAGHIPGARSIPWSKAVKDDGSFRPIEELQRIYFAEGGVDPKKNSIAYCRIGERSSHTWFVLKYLLGIANVKNYDGSWTEYGNLVGAPIER